MPTIALFGGSFNPPGTHHRRIAELLAKEFDTVKIIPCGGRPDKYIGVSAENRAVMTRLAFAGLPENVELDFFDIHNVKFAANAELQERFAGAGEVWHAVGTDLIRGGATGGSPIQRAWHRGPEMWQVLNFAVLVRPGHEFNPGDLPLYSRVFYPKFNCSSTEIRAKIAKGESVSGLVSAEVERFIGKNFLYRACPVGAQQPPGALRKIF